MYFKAFLLFLFVFKGSTQISKFNHVMLNVSLLCHCDYSFFSTTLSSPANLYVDHAKKFLGL